MSELTEAFRFWSVFETKQDIYRPFAIICKFTNNIGDCFSIFGYFMVKTISYLREEYVDYSIIKNGH